LLLVHAARNLWWLMGHVGKAAIWFVPRREHGRDAPEASVCRERVETPANRPQRKRTAVVGEALALGHEAGVPHAIYRGPFARAVLRRLTLALTNRRD